MAKEEEEEEEEFDFDCMSEEEDKPASNTVNTVKAEVNNTPASNTPAKDTATTDRNTEKTEESVNEEDDDGSEDLVDYEMPEIEAGEMEKIEDPLANEGRRKRAHPKVDYVALEAQLKKENVEYTKCTFPLQANSRARAYDQPDGLIKVLADKKTSECWRGG